MEPQMHATLPPYRCEAHGYGYGPVCPACTDPQIARLVMWIRGHQFHAHVASDGRICIGIPATCRDGAQLTALEYLRSYAQARVALGY